LGGESGTTWERERERMNRFITVLAVLVMSFVLAIPAFAGNPSGQTPKQGKASCLANGGTFFSSTQTCLTTGGECVSLSGQIVSTEFCRI
jgi:hypothetical protein